MFATIQYFLQSFKPVTIILKKVIFVFVVMSAALILFTYFWHIDSPIIATQDITAVHRAELYKLINDKELNKTKEGKAHISLVRSMMCFVNGEGCTNNPADGDKNIRNSLAGSISNVVVLPFSSPPASGIQTAYDTLQHAGFVPQANAAMGIGYAAISPYKGIWTIFRNLVFLLMVIFIIAIGFMIMFRTKINAQTVISLENSLPKIALTLLFITFSFAIAGFMIDMMYVSMFFLAGIFLRPDLPDTNVLHSTSQMLGQALWGENGGAFGYIFDPQVSANVATGFYQFIPGAVRALLDQIVGNYGYKFVMGIASKINPSGIGVGPSAPGITRLNIATMGGLLKGLNSFLPFVDATSRTGQPIASFVAGIVVLIAQQVVTAVVAPFIVIGFIILILMASLLLVFFRLILMLLKEYIQIIIQIMFAPIFIMFEIIPGQKGFTNWIKSLFIHLLTFPLLFMILLVSKTILAAPVPGATIRGAVNVNTPSVAFWQPPFIWGFDADSFKYIIAGALLFMAPELIAAFKEMTGIKATDMKLNPGAFFASAALAGSALSTPGKFYNVRQFGENIGGEGAKKWFSSLASKPVIGSMFQRSTTGITGGGGGGGTHT